MTTTEIHTTGDEARKAIAAGADIATVYVTPHGEYVFDRGGRAWVFIPN